MVVLAATLIFLSRCSSGATPAHRPLVPLLRDGGELEKVVGRPKMDHPQSQQYSVVPFALPVSSDTLGTRKSVVITMLSL